MTFNDKVITFITFEKMKKTYLKPETKWLEPFDDEALMQDVSSLNVNDNDDDEVTDPDDILVKPSYSVCDED
jgi:hypothetical protein